VIELAAFALALALRLHSYAGELTPLDELYHFKRIAYSAAHFPRVLELDPDRGEHGAFCPWPPLYDLAAGGIARIFGMRAVFYLPPLGFALFVGLAAWWAARRFGRAAAIAAAVALAASPFMTQISSTGDIDHHWLEPPLVFALLAAVCAALDRDGVRAGLLLAMAVTCGMFVQTALLVGAALAFALLFLLTDGVAGAAGFGLAALAAALYRLTRSPGYPEGAWFLGWTHVALFAGAAVACAVLAFTAKGGQRVGAARRRFFALLAGAAVVLAFPTAPASLLQGSHFFGGDLWLRTIVEFQPVWKGHLDDYASFAAILGAGALLVWPLLVSDGWKAAGLRRRAILSPGPSPSVRGWREAPGEGLLHAAATAHRGTSCRFAVALFAVVYLILTISSRRFATAAVPLLALAGAIWASTLRPRLAAVLALLLVALVPPIQLAIWSRVPSPPVKPPMRPWVRAAELLASKAPGRVLAAWSYGHLIDVAGRHPVIVDNFGTMPGEIAFDRAYDALLQNDEEVLVRWCRGAGVRYVMLEDPTAGMHSAAAVLGVESTKLPRATWWWRAWFGRGSRHFRLLSAEPTVMLLELRDDVR
jgi:asparagine N-glycosylation enzyme membrane subunit Stt3